MKVVLAFFCAALAFPSMLFERALPIRPHPDRIEWERDRSWFHNQKNLWTETLRADAQWWGKCLAFVVALALIVGGAL